MTSKEIKDWYQKEFDQVDLKSLLRTLHSYDYNPIRKNLDYMGIFRRTLVPLPIIPQDGPITELLGPIPKQLRPDWVTIQQSDITVIEQKISYCKRCNVQNEYMKFNPDWTCYSCRS